MRVKLVWYLLFGFLYGMFQNEGIYLIYSDNLKNTILKPKQIKLINHYVYSAPSENFQSAC